LFGTLTLFPFAPLSVMLCWFNLLSYLIHRQYKQRAGNHGKQGIMESSNKDLIIVAALKEGRER